MNFFEGIINNEVFTVSIIAWFVAQVLKVVLTLLTQKKLDFSRFVGSGGMPSSHSSFVMALSTGVGLQMGWDSTSYAIALVFALIVMYDASGVRRAVGKQAKLLNEIMQDKEHKFRILENEKLKELVGHTPKEVVCGAVLGILMANLLMG